MQKIFTQRERLILYLTVGIIIFSVSFNFLFGPFLKKNDNLNKEINLAKAKFKKYLKLLNQKEFIEERYQKFFSEGNTSLYLGAAPVSIFSELENLAKDSGIRIVDLRPGKKTDLAKEIMIDLRTEGDMEGHLKFIYGIENSLSILKIKKMQLNVKPNIQILEGIFSLS